MLDKSFDELMEMDSYTLARHIDADPVLKDKVSKLMEASWGVVREIMERDKEQTEDLTLYVITNMLHALMGGIVGSMNPEKITDAFKHLNGAVEDVSAVYTNRNLAEAVYLLFVQAGIVSSYTLLADIAATKEASMAAAKESVMQADSNTGNSDATT